MRRSANPDSHASDASPNAIFHGIVPPHIFKHMAGLTESNWPGLADRALESMALAAELRAERCAMAGVSALRQAAGEGPMRTVFDAQHGFSLPGHVVRKEGEDATGDDTVDEAYDALGATYMYYSLVHGRDSIDGRGLRMDATVHYRRSFNNAFWNGRQMVFGDGDGEIFGRFTRSLDVIGHELTHGVTQYEAGLDYQDQSGALNEHMSDVFGSLVKQYTLKQTAKKADWLIGEGLWAPGIKGKALRSMKAPGTAYDDPRIGSDPQPGNMKDYVDTDDDNGGVHINSGIPNHAFYLAAVALGGRAWSRAGKVWYHALTQTLRRDADFAQAASAIVEAAGTKFGKNVANTVRGAWKQVGIEVASTRRTARPKVALAGGTQHGGRGRANPRGADRRHRRAS